MFRLTVKLNFWDKSSGIPGSAVWARAIQFQGRGRITPDIFKKINFSDFSFPTSWGLVTTRSPACGH